MLPVDQEQQKDPDEIDLPDVKLDYFKAEPATITAFGISTLKWKVEGDGIYTVRLSGRKVDKMGELEVKPVSTQLYRLTVKGKYEEFGLGNVKVTVIEEGCETLSAFGDPDTGGDPDPGYNLELQIENLINAESDIYLRSKPKVSFSDNRIHLKLELRARLYKIDPYVDIEASFGLNVANSLDGVNTRLIAVDRKISVDTYLPWWTKLVLGIPTAKLIDLLDVGKEKATEEMEGAIDGLVEYIDTVARATTPPSKLMHSVQIEKDNPLAIQVTYCPRT